jgi:hypothetical protein
MDLEQTTIIVALCNHLDRMSKLSFSTSRNSFTLVIALRLPRFKPSGALGAGYRQAHAGHLKA